MSVKAIIFLPLVDRRTPPMGKFMRSDKYDKHIWNGREFDLSTDKDVTEFNSILDSALASYPGRIPQPKAFFIHEADVDQAEAAHPIKKRHAKIKRGFALAIA